MFSNNEISKLRKKFWISFGMYMKPVPGCKGEPVNWLNYNTGIRGIYFKLDASIHSAIISIELRHPLEADRMHCYNQFESMKNLLHQSTGYDWEWKVNMEDENKQLISSISLQLEKVSISNEADWPAIISFLKPRIIALDNFWEIVKDVF